MADRLDLTGDIAEALDTAAARGHAVVLAYNGVDGYPSLSFRGSAQVRGATQVAVWARKAGEGLAAAVAERPQVSLLYYAPDGPGAKYLVIKGRAHVDPAANDEVYERMYEGEKPHDPERQGVAVIVDVERVAGFGAAGAFSMER